MRPKDPYLTVVGMHIFVEPTVRVVEWSAGPRLAKEEVRVVVEIRRFGIFFIIIGHESRKDLRFGQHHGQ
jgi:hypothetical protein